MFIYQTDIVKQSKAEDDFIKNVGFTKDIKKIIKSPEFHDCCFNEAHL